MEAAFWPLSSSSSFRHCSNPGGRCHFCCQGGAPNLEATASWTSEQSRGTEPSPSPLGLAGPDLIHLIPSRVVLNLPVNKVISFACSL